MSDNSDELVKRAIMQARNEGSTLNEIKLSLSYWFHKVDRINEKETPQDPKT